MFALRLLGGLRLESDAGQLPVAAVQRRRLALLALLGLGREHGASREPVQQHLWPDNPPERARHALDQLLYATRRDLGRQVILSDATQLRLNPALVRCDVWQFEEAVAVGDWANADAAYAGPLLDGVHFACDAECEHLLDGERLTLVRAHRHVLEQLAAAAAADGRRDAAIHHYRRLVAGDPLSSRVALQLLHALASANDREGAVQHARIHKQLVRQELGIAADPAIDDFVARLTETPVHDAVPEADTSPPVTATSVADDVSSIGTSSRPPVTAEEPWTNERPNDAAQNSTERKFADHRTLATEHSRWSRITLLLASAAALVIAIGLALRASSRQPSSGSASVVAVLPFESRGGAEASQLAAGMTTLLTMNLNGAGELRGVDPRALLAFVRRRGDGTMTDPHLGAAAAEQFGAGMFVLGTIVQAGQQLRITATLYDQTRRGEPLADAHVEGTTTEFFSLVDQVSAVLAAGRQGGAKARMTQLAAVTTSSWPALKAYLQGESAMQRGRHLDAINAFRLAVTTDSTFALAYYRLALAISWADASAAEDTYAARAVQFSTRLSARDRTLLRAFRAEGIGDGAEAERLYRAILSEHPDDVETWFRLGEVQFHSAPLRGGRTIDARQSFERVVALDPNDAEAPLHLARIAALENRQPAFDSMASRYRAVSGASQQAWEIGVVADIRRKIPRDWSSAVTDALTDGQLYAAVRNAAVYGGDLDATLLIARGLASSGRVPESRAMGHILSAYIAIARGEWVEVEAAIRRASALDELLTLEHASLMAASELPGATQLFDAGRDSVRWRRRIADVPDGPHAAVSLSVHDSTRAHLLLYASALAAVRADELQHAEALARQLERLPSIARIPTLSQDLAGSIRARIEVREGRNANALRLLERSPVRAPMQYSNFSPFYNRAHDRYLHAQLLQAVGRDQEAARWYESLGGDSFYDLPYLVPAQQRLVEIHLRNGDTVRAEAHRRRLAALMIGRRAR